MTDFSTKTVLVVDDEPAQTAARLALLLEMGFVQDNITLAHSANEAYEAADAPVDLILTDNKMPRGGGVFLLQMVHAKWGTDVRSIPAIMVTNEPDDFLDNKVEKMERIGRDVLAFGMLKAVVAKDDGNPVKAEAIKVAIVQAMT